MTRLTRSGRSILFDCDGVLVDSDASVSTAWRSWAREFGIPEAAVLDTVHGRRARETVEAFVGPSLSIVERALARINQLELDGAVDVTAVAGAAALVGDLPPGRWAVVTSGTRQLVQARLRAAGLPLPLTLVTADDVVKGKPDPEGYLLAACQIGTPPLNCVVVEDAPNGVRAARLAGVGEVIGVGQRALETTADVVINDLTSLSWRDGLTVIGRPLRGRRNDSDWRSTSS